MYPILFRIGPIEVPSFGVALALGILLAWLYFRKQFPPQQQIQETLASLVTYSVLAGLIGARVNYMIEHRSEIATIGGFFSMLFSRSGLTVYGGLIAGTLTAIVYSRRNNLDVPKILDAGAGAICIGYFFGRLGCQLAGDGDYGIPSDLPWAMAYPEGTVPTPIRVHPTPVYEMILYILIFIILRLAQKRLSPGKTFALFLVLAGIERLMIEFIRTNPPVWIGLTEAQIVSLILIVAGLVSLSVRNKLASRRPGG